VSVDWNRLTARFHQFANDGNGQRPAANHEANEPTELVSKS
jgi:hypothetical protein